VLTSPPAAQKFPPRARLAFRVGVIGHRPNRLPGDQATLDALRHTLHSVLATVQAAVLQFASGDKDKKNPLYCVETPILRAVSPLAEGTDRLFADAAIELGYELLCPMPFLQEEFEKDFTSPNTTENHSRNSFRELLRRAREGAGLTTFELGGRRSDSADAYGMAGRIVLNQSDLVIAVWDRGKPAGGGGTVQTLHEAVFFHVPVLWINPFRPIEWRLLRTAADIKDIESEIPFDPGCFNDLADGAARANQSRTAQIEGIVISELASPSPQAVEAQVTRLSAENYFSERQPRFNFCIAWKLFRDLVGDHRLRLPKIVVGDFESEIRTEWPAQDDVKSSLSPTSYMPSPVESWVNRRLRAHYAWADGLADWYADHYRSAYLSIYILSAVAVLVAVLLGFMWFGAVVEVSLVGLIVILVVLGGRQLWHERWMEYRLLAELIRQMRILVPLGGGRPLPRTPAISVYESLTQTWMYWHTRALARATGLPQTKVTSDYLLACVRDIERLVGVKYPGQLAFHKTAYQRSHSISETLHSAAQDLFLISLCFILIHLLVYATTRVTVSTSLVERVTLVLAMLPMVGGGLVWLFLRSHLAFTAFAMVLVLGAAACRIFFGSAIDLFPALTALPAFGAALTSIANHGEFTRLAKRSVAMASTFEQFGTRIRDLESAISNGRLTGTGGLAEVAQLATEITQVMVDEVSDWRVVVAEQPMRLA